MRVGTGKPRGGSSDLAILALLGLMTLVPVSYYGKRAFEDVRRGLVSPTFESWRAETRGVAPPEGSAVLRNWLASSLASVPRIAVDIKFEHYETLRRKRSEAFESGFLFRSEGDLVPATIRYGGRRIKAKVRLKGDFLDHLKTEKWSLRVETRGAAELFGMRRFSLQAPHTRFYQLEPLFLDHARKEGVLAVRFRFVDVTLNGRHLGLMNIEEHFSKELLEAQGRPEGVIVRFDETDFWHSYRRSRVVEDMMEEQGQDKSLAKIFDNWKVARIKPFRPTRVAKSKALSRQADLAVAMLRGLAEGRLQPSEIFDVERLGRYLAICDLWGTWHPLRAHNLRFYLSPVTLKLEPVAFDGSVGKNWNKSLFSYRVSHFYSYVITDPGVRDAYKKNMYRFLKTDYLDELERFLSEREARYLRTLHREFPDLPRFDFVSIRRKKQLRERLEEAGPFTLRPFKPRTIFDVEYPPNPAAVYASVLGDSHELELLNPLGSPVVVDELNAETGGAVIPLSEVVDLRLPLTLPPSFHDPWPWQETPPPAVLRWALPADLDTQSIRIAGSAHVEGQRHSYEFEAIPYVAPLQRPPFPRHAAVDDLLAEHAFLAWEDGSFRTKPGRWEVTQPLRIPPEVTASGGPDGGEPLRHPGLTVAAGTTLLFGRRASIRLSGPLHLEGSAGSPVILRGREGRSWGGLTVTQSPERSVWSHATIEDTDPALEQPWPPTGGITFYESDVTMTDCALTRTAAEDALNIIRSSFDLRNLTVLDTVSDALDSDFSTGTITSSRFANIGGDGVDLSGSDVRIHGTSFQGVRDKAMSVGESSTLHASAVDVRGAGAALASKDGSSATVEGVLLRKISHFGLMAYNKKPEYGSASLTVRGVDYDGSATLQAAQRGNVLVIDGKRVHTQRIDVEALYEEGFMRK